MLIHSTMWTMCQNPRTQDENTTSKKKRKGEKKQFLFLNGSQSNVVDRYEVNKELPYNWYKTSLETIQDLDGGCTSCSLVGWKEIRYISVTSQ